MMVPQPKRRKLDHDDPSLQSFKGNNSLVAAAESAEKKTVSKNLKTATRQAASVSINGFESTLFNLQVEEMLIELKPNYATRRGPIDNALRKLKFLIDGTQDRQPLTVSEASKIMQNTYNVVIPFPDPKPRSDASYKLSFARPSNINVVGSYIMETMTKSDGIMVVDMVVTIPASILQDKDYLNFRYFYKRAYYTACLAAELQTHATDEFDFSFDCLNGNELQSVLLITPCKNYSSKDLLINTWKIRLIPAAPENFFPEGKLLPTKNALRPKVGTSTVSNALTPTPFYNSTLRSDSTYGSYLKLLSYSSKHAKGFVNACLLGRTWLRQRGFGGSLSKGGFGQFEWAVLTALLLQGGGPKGSSILSPGYSSYQLFKAVVRYLSINDLATKPIIFSSQSQINSISDTPMFYDGPRGLNFLFKMSPWSYHLLRYEASISMETLNDIAFDQFEVTFIMKKSLPILNYDSSFHLFGKTSSLSRLPGEDTYPSALCLKTYEVLKEGLSDRVKIIQIETPERDSWSLGAAPTSMPTNLKVSFIFDPANIDRAVDHGPAADDEKMASKFRTFWGDKAELRRFKDGSILESLVWASTGPGSISRDIITYLVKRHISSNLGGELTFTVEGFSSFLSDSEISSKAFTNLKEAFNVLEKSIRDMEAMPLQMKQFSAVSAQLRSASQPPPIFSARHCLREPAEVLIQFEGSGRWPDDIAAIQRTKIAFLLKIGSILKESHHVVNTNLGLENTGHKLLNCAFLDVFYPSGAVFRLRIHCDREHTLLERQTKDKSADSRSREEASSALTLYKRLYIHSSLHSQSVETIRSRFPLLSPTIRLTKLWFDSHMLSGQFREELIEMLVARVFLQPYPWLAPSSVTAGFLRTLHFLARWDWRKTPLIVDFSSAMTQEEVAAAHVRLEAWRQIDPSMSRIAIVAASNHDPSGTVFTDAMPSKVVAARLTSLARSAYNMMHSNLTELDPKVLFVSSTADYDFLIHIAQEFSEVKRGKKATNTIQFKNLVTQEEEDLLMVAYEPVGLFLEEIRSTFTSSVVLFYNAQTSNVIGGLWNPLTNSSTAFKVTTPYCTMPVDARVVEADKEEASVKIDKAVILSEIARLGGDMVASIEVPS